MLDEDFAVEVIHLMLQCHGIETVAVNLECLTISVLGLEENTFKAFHFFGEAGHREASLSPDNATFTFDDFRIDEFAG